MEAIRNGDLIELWIGGAGHPEGDLIGTWHCDYNGKVVASILRFEQSEGRHKK